MSGATGAVLSNDGRYRYYLERHWNDLGSGTLGWVMLNPSTADALEDDPTIRRCRGFSEGLGYSGMVVCNLMAYRSTDPRLLPNDPELAEGPLRDSYLVRMALECDDIILAWGAGRPKAYTQERVTDTLDMLRRARSVTSIPGCFLHCLGTTKSRDPKHPLYLAADTPLEPWDR